MTRFQKINRKLHLWLGLTCGLIASFSGITGSVYVWQPEISALLNPELLRIEKHGELDKEKVLKTSIFLIEKNGTEISKLHLPYREQQTISIDFKDGKTEYFHPYSGNNLGEKSRSILFFEQLLVFHRTLGIPDYGKYILGSSALIFIFLLLQSGVKIWWDLFAKRISNGFKINWNSSRKLFNYDLHKVLGIYFFLPLFIMGLTGAYFTYNKTYKSVLGLLDKSQKKNSTEVLGNFPRYESIETLFANFEDTYSIRALYFPTNETGVFKIRLIKSLPIQSGLRKTKELELRSNGELVKLSDYESDPLSIRIAGQFYSIHIGEIAGILGRVFVFVAGFVPVTLLITGWKIHRVKKK